MQQNFQDWNLFKTAFMYKYAKKVKLDKIFVEIINFKMTESETTDDYIERFETKRLQYNREMMKRNTNTESESNESISININKNKTKKKQLHLKQIMNLNRAILQKNMYVLLKLMILVWLFLKKVLSNFLLKVYTLRV